MRNLVLVVLIALAPCAGFGQPAAGAPAFEVASIKPAAPQSGGHIMVSMGGDPGRVNYTNVSLKNVLMRAYNVRTYQISGPSWIDSQRYDIVAKVPDGTPKEQIPAMLQNLLADRFKLTLHRETKDQPVYALVVGKNGPKLKKAEEDAASAAPAHGGGPLPGGAPGRPRRAMMMINNGRLEAKGATLAGFSDMLSNLMDRPVVDMTELQGNYDIALDVSMDDLVGMRKMAPMGGPGPGPAAGPGPGPGARMQGEDGPAPESAPAASIFTAIQQLGLKLDSRKAPIEYIVVDSAEKVPSEN